MDEDCHVDLVFQRPTHSIFEVIKTFWINDLNETEKQSDDEKPDRGIQKEDSEVEEDKELLSYPLPQIMKTNQDEQVGFEEIDKLRDDDERIGKEDQEKIDEEDTNVDLLFRQPVDISFELIYTIPENTASGLEGASPFEDDLKKVRFQVGGDSSEEKVSVEQEGTGEFSEVKSDHEQDESREKRPEEDEDSIQCKNSEEIEISPPVNEDSQESCKNESEELVETSKDGLITSPEEQLDAEEDENIKDPLEETKTEHESVVNGFEKPAENSESGFTTSLEEKSNTGEVGNSNQDKNSEEMEHSPSINETSQDSVTNGSREFVETPECGFIPSPEEKSNTEEVESLTKDMNRAETEISPPIIENQQESANNDSQEPAENSEGGLITFLEEQSDFCNSIGSMNREEAELSPQIIENQQESSENDLITSSEIESVDGSIQVIDDPTESVSSQVSEETQVEDCEKIPEDSSNEQIVKYQEKPENDYGVEEDWTEDRSAEDEEISSETLERLTTVIENITPEESNETFTPESKEEQFSTLEIKVEEGEEGEPLEESHKEESVPQNPKESSSVEPKNETEMEKEGISKEDEETRKEFDLPHEVGDKDTDAANDNNIIESAQLNSEPIEISETSSIPKNHDDSEKLDQPPCDKDVQNPEADAEQLTKPETMEPLHIFETTSKISGNSKLSEMHGIPSSDEHLETGKENQTDTLQHEQFLQGVIEHDDIRETMDGILESLPISEMNEQPTPVEQSLENKMGYQSEGAKDIADEKADEENTCDHQDVEPASISETSSAEREETENNKDESTELGESQLTEEHTYVNTEKNANLPEKIQSVIGDGEQSQHDDKLVNPENISNEEESEELIELTKTAGFTSPETQEEVWSPEETAEDVAQIVKNQDEQKETADDDEKIITEEPNNEGTENLNNKEEAVDESDSNACLLGANQVDKTENLDEEDRKTKLADDTVKDWELETIQNKQNKNDSSDSPNSSNSNIETCYEIEHGPKEENEINNLEVEDNRKDPNEQTGDTSDNREIEEAEVLNHDNGTGNIEIQDPQTVSESNIAQSELVNEDTPNEKIEDENISVEIDIVQVQTDEDAAIPDHGITESDDTTVETPAFDELPTLDADPQRGDIHVKFVDSEIPFQEQYSNDYMPFGTESTLPNDEQGPVHDEIKEWKDHDVISLKSLKSLVAEVGCTTNTEPVTETLLTDRIVEQTEPEETIKILQVVPSETSLFEMDIANDPKIIHVPIPPVIITHDEKGDEEVVTESEISEMRDPILVDEQNIDRAIEQLDNLSTPIAQTFVKVAPMQLQSVQNSPRAENATSNEQVAEEEGEENSEGRDSIGDLSERTIQRFNTSFDDPARRDSFSSISSFGDRQKFRTAVESIRQDLLPFQSSVSQFLDSTPDPHLVVNASMDSPSDLSPNSPNPPSGFEQPEMQPISEKDHPSTDGSVDSSGFEKVDHEGLEEFGNTISDPMQQSIFGSLQAGDKNMSHDDVIEKDYFDSSKTAKLLDSPIAEEAKQLVDEAVESASQFQKPRDDYTGDFDDIVIPTRDDTEAPAPTQDFYGDLLEGGHKKPGSFELEDAVAEKLTRSPEVPDIPEAVVAEENLLDIGDVVENVHNEIDDFVRDTHKRDPTPPLDDLDEAPQFGRQTPADDDEQTFDRNGPLTIPEEVLPEKDVREEEEEEIPPRFESVPRPPTPPKDISDEDMKPSTVNLGPAPTHSSSTPHHSILKHHNSADPWFDFKSIDPAVLDLIYWRDPKKSAISLSLSLLALFVLGRYPLLSVIAYTGLGLLAATLGFRIFKTIEAQIKKTGGENPFQEILAQDLSLPQEKVHAQVDVLVEHGTCLANRAKKLLFVENILDSVQFGLLLWALTYVASWFSGFALAFLSIVGVFSLPKLYETYQEPIDAHVDVIKGHIQNVQNLLEEKIPFLRRPAAATEEKKDQ